MKEFDKFFTGQMNKTVIKVPDGIQFISDWPSFSLPQGHSIIDKSLCGCGFTEWCLRNSRPTIVASPRKVLLENKEAQHNYIVDEDGNLVLNPDPEFPVYYFRNEKEAVLDYDEAGSEPVDPTKLILMKKAAPTEEEKQEYLRALKMQLCDWITKYNVECQIRHKRLPNPKILVTYDSLRHVVDALGKDIINFDIVVDEFQSIFVDSSFKASVELEFVDLLMSLPEVNVAYVSATPMMDRYLGSINYFSSLPYYELDWGNRAERISIEWVPTRSLATSCVDLIKSYKSGLYPIKVSESGEIRESHEVVFFVNSVKTICDIIRKAELTPSECNIICADMVMNNKRLKKLGKGFKRGSVPTNKQYNKMFTFCTRTAYLGADFYSDNAYTVVCSDINIKTLNVDIALDLPQIVGRQRLAENVFRNEVKVLYVSKRKDDEITVEDFMKEDNKKEEETGELLSTASIASAWVSKGSRDRELYQHDYVGFKRDGSAQYNYLVKVSYIRAFEISRKEYQENILVKRDVDAPDTLDFSVSSDLSLTATEFISEFRKDFRQDANFERRMKLVCTMINENKAAYDLIKHLVPINYRNYIDLLGTSVIRANSYREAEIQRVFLELQYSDKLSEVIKTSFEIGRKYTKSKLKEMLGEIYQSVGLSKTPKASDLDSYFELKSCLITNKETGKRDNGFEIIRRKD